MIDAALAEEGEEQRNNDDAGAGDEGGFGGRGEAQAGGLKGIAGEHEESDLHAGPSRGKSEATQGAPEEDGHDRGGERETDGEVDEDGNVGERVFDHDEGGAPDERGEAEGQVGLNAFAEYLAGHERMSLCGGRSADKAMDGTERETFWEKEGAGGLTGDEENST